MIRLITEVIDFTVCLVITIGWLFVIFGGIVGTIYLIQNYQP